MTATHTINGTPAVQDGKRFRYLDGRLMPPNLWEGAVPLVSRVSVPIRWDHLSLVLRAAKLKQQVGDEWGNCAICVRAGVVRLHIRTKDGDIKYLIEVPDTITIEADRLEG